MADADAEEYISRREGDRARTGDSREARRRGGRGDGGWIDVWPWFAALRKKEKVTVEAGNL